jgi:hypothetical protein
MRLFQHIPTSLIAVFAISSLVEFSSAADIAAPLSAGQLASQLSALRQNGASYVRLRMEIKSATTEILQVQIKQRLTKNSSEVVYQVLFPVERKGEAVLLKRAGNRAVSGSSFTPLDSARAITDMKEPLFGSDLTYEDAIDNFYAWDQQAIVGTETVEGVPCQILESKPGKGERSSYARVRSWIDTRRMVPLRVEKYSGSGQLLRRITTTRVVADAGRNIPANLSVRAARQGSTTELDGSRIRHDVKYTDLEFTVEGLKDLTAPTASLD